MFSAFIQTYVNNNVRCCGSRDVLLSNARNIMMCCNIKREREWDGERERKMRKQDKEA
jgi:hypothetical protein